MDANKKIQTLLYDRLRHLPLAETRVQREAEVLLRNGYEVDVICLRLPDDLPVDQL